MESQVEFDPFSVFIDRMIGRLDSIPTNGKLYQIHGSLICNPFVIQVAVRILLRQEVNR